MYWSKEENNKTKNTKFYHLNVECEHLKLKYETK